jgi:hypothetical protein
MIHYSVRLLWEISAGRRGRSGPLATFKLPQTESPDRRSDWSRTVAGQARQIPEDVPGRYEHGMLQRWLDRDIEFQNALEECQDLPYSIPDTGSIELEEPSV